MLRMLQVVRKGQAYKMEIIEFKGCPVGFTPAGQPLTDSEQQTSAAGFDRRSRFAALTCPEVLEGKQRTVKR